MATEQYEIQVEKELTRHNWRLVENLSQFVRQVCNELRAEGVIGGLVIAHYGILIHKICRNNGHHNYRRSWVEIDEWLMKRIRSKVSNQDDRDDIKQKTLIKSGLSPDAK